MYALITTNPNLRTLSSPENYFISNMMPRHVVKKMSPGVSILKISEGIYSITHLLSGFRLGVWTNSIELAEKRYHTFADVYGGKEKLDKECDRRMARSTCGTLPIKTVQTLVALNWL